MFGFVCRFPGNLASSCRGRPLPAGPGAGGDIMPGCRGPAEPSGAREAPPAPLRPGRPRWRFRPRWPLGEAGDRRPSAGDGGEGGGEQGLSFCPCVSQLPH